MLRYLNHQARVALYPALLPSQRRMVGQQALHEILRLKLCTQVHFPAMRDGSSIDRRSMFTHI